MTTSKTATSTATKTSISFPVWKYVIFPGIRRGSQFLPQNARDFSANRGPLNMLIELADAEINGEFSLVKVTLRKIGMEGAVSLPQILAQAIKLGLDSCPRLLAPSLLQDYREVGGNLIIGSLDVKASMSDTLRPLPEEYCNAIFALTKDCTGERRLREVCVCPKTRFSTVPSKDDPWSEFEWLFVKPRTDYLGLR